MLEKAEDVCAPPGSCYIVRTRVHISLEMRTYNGSVDRKFAAAQGLLAEVKPGFRLR